MRCRRRRRRDRGGYDELPSWLLGNELKNLLLNSLLAFADFASIVLVLRPSRFDLQVPQWILLRWESRPGCFSRMPGLSDPRIRRNPELRSRERKTERERETEKEGDFFLMGYQISSLNQRDDFFPFTFWMRGNEGRQTWRFVFWLEQEQVVSLPKTRLDCGFCYLGLDSHQCSEHPCAW